MMRRPTLAALAGALLLAPLSLAAQEQKPEGDPVVNVDEADAKMNAASQTARDTSPRWLAILADPPVGTTSITFKFPLEGYEHIWVGEVARDGDYLTGRLMNNPHAEGWRLGDAVRVPVSGISDWGYVDAVGRAHGFHTVRVMLEFMPPEQAERVRRSYGFTD